MDDSDAKIEVEGEHDEQVVQQPRMHDGISEQLLLIIESYGWIILLALVIFIYVRSQWSKKQPRRNEGLEYDADTALARQAAMDEARRKMQERMNARSAQYAEEQKKKEEEKRKAKIEDWERHREGKGYRSKYRPTEEPSSSTQPRPAAKKKPLRDPDYSPLSGDGGSCSWRPGARRGGASGG